MEEQLIPLPYTLTRSSRRTLSLQIDKHGELIARAPMRMSIRFIEDFVERKREWIKKHQTRIQNQVSRGEKKKYSETEIREIKHKLREYIVPRVQEFWEWQNLPKYTSIKITKSERRWWSCSARNGLCFSYRLAEYLNPPPEKGELEGVTKNKDSSHITHPSLSFASLAAKSSDSQTFSGREFIDAIIVHELAHLKEKNHQKPFWNLVYIMMPEYEQIIQLYKKWFSLDSYPS